VQHVQWPGARQAILLVFLVALVMRIGIALWLPAEIIWPDGSRYERVAMNLLEGNGFGDLAENRRSVPTQPLLIAAVYSAFGEHNYVTLRLVSAAIGAFSCVLGFLLARRLFGHVAGVLAGLMLAVYPHLVYVSALFEYPQALAILFMSGYLLVHLKFADSPRLSTLIGASALLGLLVLTLPSLLVYVPVFLLLILSRHCSWRRNVAHVVVAAVALIVTIGSWTWRNYEAYGHVIVVNAAAGDNFWVANNETYERYGKKAVVPACARGYEDTSYCREHRAVLAELKRRDLPTTARVLEHERLSWEHGLRYAREAPFEFAALAVRKFLVLWSPWPDAVHTGAERGGSSRDLISAVAYLPLLLFACVGLVMSLREHARRLMPVYTFMLMFIAPFAVFLPTMRYRLPIDFLLAVFAALPLSRLWSLLLQANARRRLRSPHPAAAAPRT
jgi:4-amino-4-deoxy-L-arabinose transferase-like glycosyltransferase